MTTDFRALCAELLDALDSGIPSGRIRISPLADRAHAALAEPESEGPQPMPVSDAFAVVQRRLDQLASDQELMIYRWPDGDWTIDHTNPERYVQLGESSGRYSSTGGTFWEAVNNLAALLPDHAALAEPRIIRADRDEAGPYMLVAEPPLELPTDEELLQIFDAACLSEGGTTDEIHLRGLRAVLARWGHQPAPPAEGEVAELVDQLAGDQEMKIYRLPDLNGTIDSSKSSVPQPVPVSERLPGPEDCLDEGWAWFFNPRTGWRQATQPVHTGYTHWLPAHALPLPSPAAPEAVND